MLSLILILGVTLTIRILVTLLVEVVVVGVILYLLWWFIGFCSLPEPLNKVARVLIALFAVVFAINLLLSLIGHPLFTIE